MNSNKTPFPDSNDERCLVPFLEDVLAVASVSDQPPVIQIAIGASGGV
jgi:hypothetical protein